LEYQPQAYIESQSTFQPSYNQTAIMKTKIGFVFSLILLLCLGCSRENPGTWPQEKVSEKISQSLELSGLNLQPRAEGGFTGTGKREEETITVIVTQNPAESRIDWDAKGDRGFVETGFFELR
jgi:hypothetical protein